MTRIKIGIIGAGHQATETASYLRMMNREIIFFADEATDGKKEQSKEGIKLINLAQVPKEFEVLTAVGQANLRKRLAGQLTNRFANCIASPLGDSVVFGEDVTIAPGCTFTTNIRIGSHVLINIGCNISHDNNIDDYVTISPGVNIAGKCRIGESSFIGIGASIIDGVAIGRKCVIGAGAMVIDDVPDGSTVAGVPARPLESR